MWNSKAMMKIFLNWLSIIFSCSNGVGALFGGWNLMNYPDGSSMHITTHGWNTRPSLIFSSQESYSFTMNGICSFIAIMALVLSISTILCLWSRGSNIAWLDPEYRLSFYVSSTHSILFLHRLASYSYFVGENYDQSRQIRISYCIVKEYESQDLQHAYYWACDLPRCSVAGRAVHSWHVFREVGDWRLRQLPRTYSISSSPYQHYSFQHGFITRGRAQHFFFSQERSAFLMYTFIIYTVGCTLQSFLFFSTALHSHSHRMLRSTCYGKQVPRR